MGQSTSARPAGVRRHSRMNIVLADDRSPRPATNSAPRGSPSGLGASDAQGPWSPRARTCRARPFRVVAATAALALARRPALQRVGTRRRLGNRPRRYRDPRAWLAERSSSGRSTRPATRSTTCAFSSVPTLTQTTGDKRHRFVAARGASYGCTRITPTRSSPPPTPRAPSRAGSRWDASRASPKRRSVAMPSK